MGSNNRRSLSAARRSEMSPYATIELLMRVFSCVATFATFSRILREQNLSAVFILLSLTPCVLVALHRIPQFRQEPNLMSTITGLAIGVIASFLSESVGHATNSPKQPDSLPFYAEILSHLELFHIPVLAGSITYTYCLYFMYLPSPIRCRLLFFIAFSATIAISVGATILNSDASMFANLKSMLFVFVNMYLLVVFPVVKRTQKAWLICMACGWWWLNWQNGHFEYLVWDMTRPRFAVPACITGTIIVFFVQPLKPSIRESPLLDDTEEQRKNVMLNGIVWFCMAYIVERFSLTLIKARKQRLGEVAPPSDVWVSNAFMIAFLFVVSPNLKIGVTIKVMIIVWGTVAYTGICLVHHCLCNAIFIDCVLGLTVLFVIES